jgi:hypothetical protein
VSTREGRFPNGMRVVFESVADSEIAGVALAVDAGSANDEEGEAGLLPGCVFRACSRTLFKTKQPSKRRTHFTVRGSSTANWRTWRNNPRSSPA